MDRPRRGDGDNVHRQEDERRSGRRDEAVGPAHQRVADDAHDHGDEQQVQPVGAGDLAVVVDRRGRQRDRRDEETGEQRDAGHPLHRADGRHRTGPPVEQVVRGEGEHRPDAEHDAHGVASHLGLAAEDGDDDAEHADGGPADVPAGRPLPEPLPGDEQHDAWLQRLDDGKDGHRRVVQGGEDERQVDAEQRPGEGGASQHLLGDPAAGRVHHGPDQRDGDPEAHRHSDQRGRRDQLGDRWPEPPDHHDRGHHTGGDDRRRQGVGPGRPNNRRGCGGTGAHAVETSPPVSSPSSLVVGAPARAPRWQLVCAQSTRPTGPARRSRSNRERSRRAYRERRASPSRLLDRPVTRAAVSMPSNSAGAPAWPCCCVSTASFSPRNAARPAPASKNAPTASCRATWLARRRSWDSAHLPHEPANRCRTRLGVLHHARMAELREHREL